MQQDDLIRQLQDQHFQQYMQQVYQQQLLAQQQQASPPTSVAPNGIKSSSPESGNNNASPIPDGVTPIAPCGDDEEGELYMKFVTDYILRKFNTMSLLTSKKMS